VLTASGNRLRDNPGGGSGHNAAIHVRIPLWDRSNDLKTAQARASWQRAEDSVRTAFLADVQSLCEQAAQVKALDTLRAFQRDRLTYRQEQVDQGLADPDTLSLDRNRNRNRNRAEGRAGVATRGGEA
jgi:hypothetical protein